MASQVETPEAGQASRAAADEPASRMPDRSIRRVLWTELRRGTAPVALLAIGVSGAGMLFNESEDWAGRWGPLAEYMRVLMIALIPLVVAAAAWQAGRDRRRRIGELLDTTARPSWQHVTVGWAGVTLGAVVGFTLAWLSGAVLVARVATYSGHGWWWTLAVGALALMAASALGTALGRLVPGRLVAPLAGIGTYVLVGMATYNDRLSLLAPSFDYPTDGAAYLDGSVHLLQAIWLAGLAAALVVVSAASRRWLALVPALVALAAAVPLLGGDEEDHWKDDPAAREAVCSDDDGAEVCMARVNAFLLDDATEPVRAQLRRWDGIDGGFGRAVDRTMMLDDSTAAPEGTAVIDLRPFVSWNGAMSEVTEYGDSLASVFALAADDVVYRNCDRQESNGPSMVDRRLAELSGVAYLWALGELDPVGVVVEDGEPADFQLLLAKPGAEQNDWMGRYLEVARSCDAQAAAELLAELQ